LGFDDDVRDRRLEPVACVPRKSRIGPAAAGPAPAVVVAPSGGVFRDRLPPLAPPLGVDEDAHLRVPAVRDLGGVLEVVAAVLALLVVVSRSRPADQGGGEAGSRRCGLAERIFYSDMNLFQEAWLGEFTSEHQEAVVDTITGRATPQDQQLNFRRLGSLRTRASAGAHNDAPIVEFHRARTGDLGGESAGRATA